jgi:iron complex outermembrane receptor protein
MMGASPAAMAHALASDGAAAQPAPPAQSAQTDDTIVVTAERRTQSQQEVPIAVTAITGDALTRGGSTNSVDLGAAAPGLVMPLQRNSSTPYLRGVGTQNGGAAEEGSVATYVDGVYIASLSAANFSFNNIERVEVLRGPQGTLFGRNATGGLIHIITRDPSFTPELNVNVGYANYQTLSGGLYATAGLTDTIATDIAVYFTNQGQGYGRNISGIAGVNGTDVNLRDEWAVRSSILVRPSDRFHLRITADYDHRESDIGNTRTVYPGAVDSGGTVFRGTIYDSQQDIVRNVNAHQWGLSGHAEFELSDNVRLTSTTAFRYAYNFALFDQDAGPVRIIDAPITDTASTFQQELLLLGTAGRFDYTLGLFYYWATAGFQPLSLRSSAIPSQNLDRTSKMTTNSYAGFAQGTYHLTDRTSLTLGARFTRDERQIVGRDVAVAGNPQPAGTLLRSTATNTFPNQQTFDKITWRAALEHRFSDQVMVYASASRGFKSGIFNATNPYQAPATPETLDAYEVGFKTDLFDRIVRFNASAFYYDYSDIQLTRIVAGTTQLFNAARARIEGLDAELTIRPRIPTGHLEFRAGLSILDGKYTSFPNAPFTTRNPAGGNTQTSGDASGNDTIRTPPYTLNLSVDYSVPVGSLTLGFNGSYYLNDGFYWDPDNRLREPSYDLVNGEVRLVGPNERWRLSAFVRNLFNRKYDTFVGSSTLGDQLTPGTPRTYGVSLAFRFGG